LAAPSRHSIWLSGVDYAGMLVRSLRLHNWLKNILLFVPALSARTLDPAATSALCIAFLAFSCTASAHYLVNDFLDKDHDRHDQAKGQRPQAAGKLSPSTAAGLTVGLVFIAVICASWLPNEFQLALAGYLFLCLAYSLLLKCVLMIDVLTLVMLYNLRLVAGASAASVPLPNLLLLTFGCFFLTLALLKRVTQLADKSGSRERLLGRPYNYRDLPILRGLAGAAGIASILAFGFAVSAFGKDAARPNFLWFTLPLLAIWLGHCYFIANLGKLNEDLIAFVASDRHSLITLAAMVMLLMAAG
jgi:4-hydroxybenzoate polyprenyltransferase